MERLLDFFTPKNYLLNLFIDKHAKTLKGTVKSSGKTKTADLIKLHSVGQSIDFFKINGKNVDFSLENGVLTAPAAPRSDVTVEVGFHGPLKEDMQGAYLSTYQHEGKEERIVSTQFESHYARECFPCIDEPAAKATFDLSITIPDKDDIVLANTEPVASGEKCASRGGSGGYDRGLAAEPRNDGREERASTKAPSTASEHYHWSFAKTPKMSTYLLAFAIGKFNVVEGKTKNGITVRTFAPLNQDPKLLKLPNDIAIKSLDYYEDLFKTPYPLKKLDQVAIPDFEAGAMENWGLVTYRESQLLCAKDSGLDTKKYAALTITHELSHQWLGNLVTMKWWNDLWLNESFATIMEYYATDRLFPKFHIWDDFFISDCFAALQRDAVQGVQAVREDVKDPAEIATLFDPCIVYAKGAHLMLFLIREMGQENFLKGLKDYFEKHAYKNAEATDLWTALEPYAHGFSVRDLMTAWLTQPGYPVVTDEAQQRFLLDGTSDSSHYPIPDLKDDMSGHYLINLSGPEFEDALKNFDNLSHEQQLRLLIDRLLLANTPIVSSASLLPLIDKFKSSSNATIWGLVSDIIAKITLFIDYDSPEEKQFKAYIYSIVKKELAKFPSIVSDASTPVNDIELKDILLGEVYYTRNPEGLAKLATLYSDDFSQIPADLTTLVLASNLYLHEAEFFDAYLSRYQLESDPAIRHALLMSLARVHEPTSINTVFSLLKNPKIVRAQDHLSLLLSLRRNPHTRHRALDWMLENWNYIYKLNGEKTIEDYPRYFAMTIDKEADAKKFFDFFTPLMSDPVLARALRVAKNDIDSTLTLIKLDQPAVLKAIKKLS